jgi:hypothetical protein
LQKHVGIEKDKLDPLTLLAKKNPKGFETLLYTLHFLATTPDLTPFEKVKGFDKIFSSQDFSAVIAAKGLFQLKDKEWIHSDLDPVAYFTAYFNKIIPLEDFKGDVSKSIEIFLDSRDPLAIITYAACLNTLGDSRVMSCLSKFVHTVIDGTFPQVRYETSNNPHLRQIFNLRPDLVEKWQASLEMKFDDLATTGEEQKPIDTRTWIQTRLFEFKHLGDTELTYLSDYLKAETPEDKKKISASLSEKLKEISKEKEKKELREKITKATSKNERTKLKKDLKKLQTLSEDDKKVQTTLMLQESCMVLLAAEPGNQLDCLKKIQGICAHLGTNEFSNDVAALITELSKQKQPGVGQKGLRAMITDDPIDLLLCGTEINDSCQRVNGDASKNKGLLGYLMDGKNRLLVIKDSSGRNIARCKLSLLWDGEEPVLYREYFYPCTLTPENKRMLNELAKQVARNMGLKLTSDDGGELYGKTLYSEEGPAPFEYSDGGGGVCRNGCYSITSAKIIDLN